MPIDKSTTIKIAHLARLAIQQDEIGAYTQDLDKIIHLVHSMNTIDTAQIEPLSHALDITICPKEKGGALADDRVTETVQCDIFQHLAPAVAAGHYIVSKVIE